MLVTNVYKYTVTNVYKYTVSNVYKYTVSNVYKYTVTNVYKYTVTNVYNNVPNPPPPARSHVYVQGNSGCLVHPQLSGGSWQHPCLLHALLARRQERWTLHYRG